MTALLENKEKFHTTPLGAVRIRKNLSLVTEDVVPWIKKQLCRADALIERKGKNWYVSVDDVIITINASSYTVITAHKKTKR